MENREDILKELRDIAPRLASVKKVNLYDVPEGYFMNFKAELVKKVRLNEVHEELKAIAPEFSGVDKKVVFDVPFYYFNLFPETVLNKIREEQKPQVLPAKNLTGSLNTLLEGITNVIFKPKYSVAFAGFATILIIGGMLLVKIEQCSDVNCQMAKLSNEELNTYFSQHADEFNSNLLDNSVDDNKVIKQTEKVNGNMEHLIKNEVSDEELNNAILD